MGDVGLVVSERHRRIVLDYIDALLELVPIRRVREAMPSAPQWEIHDRLRKARETAGLTQTQVATRLNKSLNTIYLYEVGHRHIGP